MCKLAAMIFNCFSHNLTSCGLILRRKLSLWEINIPWDTICIRKGSVCAHGVAAGYLPCVQVAALQHEQSAQVCDLTERTVQWRRKKPPKNYRHLIELIVNVQLCKHFRLGRLLVRHLRTQWGPMTALGRKGRRQPSSSHRCRWTWEQQHGGE